MNSRKQCPICDGESNSPFLICKDNTVSKESFNIVSCNNCGFKFTNPIPEENKIGDYYKSEEYISHSNTNKGLVNKVVFEFLVEFELLELFVFVFVLFRPSSLFGSHSRGKV